MNTPFASLPEGSGIEPETLIRRKHKARTVPCLLTQAIGVFCLVRATGAIKAAPDVPKLLKLGLDSAGIFRLSKVSITLGTCIRAASLGAAVWDVRCSLDVGCRL